ncbi:hypothetical protein N4J17_00640 [Methylococcus capsulatus]|uniref:Uncharacterized protein n=1 Tax=Methylococcus capsulatus TaxID=414 RepID=A0ABZ2F4M1_METCP
MTGDTGSVEGSGGGLEAVPATGAIPVGVEERDVAGAARPGCGKAASPGAASGAGGALGAGAAGVSAPPAFLLATHSHCLLSVLRAQFQLPTATADCCQLAASATNTAVRSGTDARAAADESSGFAEASPDPRTIKPALLRRSRARKPERR